MQKRTDYNGGTYFYSEGLYPVRHGFSTRLGGVSTGVLESLNLSVRRGDTPENVRENWRRLGAAAGLDLTRAVYAQQVHSAEVRIAHAADAQPPELKPRFTCDGFVTNEPGVPLAVFMADCLPALLHDPAAGVIGAVLHEPLGALVRPRADGKALLDLKGVNARRLVQLGVPAGQIAVSDACTMCRPDVFWSHRATDGRRGVQAAVITL